MRLMHFFFYGTLMDADVLGTVIGREGAVGSQAKLAGFRRSFAAGKHYPIITKDASAHVVGIAVKDLTEDEKAALRFYEGSNYTVDSVAIELLDSGETVEALVFSPVKLESAGPDGWDLTTWQTETKPKFMDRLRKMMGKYRASKKRDR